MTHCKGNPFQPRPDKSNLVDEQAFRDLYAAASFAESAQLLLDTRLTIVWSRCSERAASNPRPYFNLLTASLRGWLKDRGTPPAWLYAHECGGSVGLHTHMALYVPPWSRRAPKSDQMVPVREQFRAWAQSWADFQFPERATRAIRVRGPATPSVVEHWRAFHYLLKGYDPQASIPGAPPDTPLRLMDLMAFGSVDPGKVSLQPRCGSSQSLSSTQRSLGSVKIAPTRTKSARKAGTTAAWPCDQLTAFEAAAAPLGEPYVSPYDRGSRDVRDLYPAEFLDVIPGRRRAIENAAPHEDGSASAAADEGDCPDAVEAHNRWMLEFLYRHERDPS